MIYHIKVKYFKKSGTFLRKKIVETLLWPTGNVQKKFGTHQSNGLRDTPHKIRHTQMADLGITFTSM